MSSHTELNFPLSSKPEIKTYSNIKTYKEIYIYIKKYKVLHVTKSLNHMTNK